MVKNNLLIIASHLSTGGAPQFTLNKIELLMHHYNIVCVEYNFLSPDYVVQRNKIINLLGDKFISLGENKDNLIKVIEDFDPEIIFVEELSETFIDSKMLPILYKADRQYKIFETTHSSYDTKYLKKFLPDKFIFVSEYSKQIYESLGVDSVVIEYPIDKKAKPQKDAIKKLNLDSDKKHVVNIGLFTPGKNQDYAFEIARQFEGKNVTFHFVGNQAGNFADYWGPLMENIPSNCVVWGEKDNTEDFIIASDLFLFTSKLELNPLVVKEALMYDSKISMFNLETYCGSYDNEECISFLTGDVDTDVIKIAELLDLEYTNDGHYDFIEIGTSDFDTLIEVSNNLTKGISIEPIKYYLDKLPNKLNVKKVQAAMSDKEGSIDIYYIEDKHIDVHGLPWWLRGSNSVNNPHPFAVKEIGEELYNELVTVDNVPTITWPTLIETYNIKSIDYLKVDTEGYDHIILNEYLNECDKNPELLANKIKFECHGEVSNREEIDKLLKRFVGYEVEYLLSDIILKRQKIPRIIHQTYRTSRLPYELEENVEKLKKMNPTFEYRFYNDEDCINFIKENYPEEKLKLYLSINDSYGPAKADYFRYLLMYKVGGVYLDIKSSTTVPLEETLQYTDEYLLSHWAGRDWAGELNYELGEFQNWHIICKPEHPFLKKTIELVEENIRNYKNGVGKEAVLKTTGPIPYSKAILSLLDQHRPLRVDSPVREYQVSEEIGLSYLNTRIHHHGLYKGYPNSEKLINHELTKRGYVLYSNAKYFNIVSMAAKSIRTFSDLPIYVYMLDSDLIVNVENVTTIKWVCDLENDNDMYESSDSNFYINRNNLNIYKLLIQRPLIVKDVLTKYLDIVAYVDSDSIATPNVDKIFDLYTDTNLPYFVQGIYDYLFANGRGGAETKENLTTTLEHPACELFSVNQKIRERYRQTGYFVASKNCVDFMDEWYWMCINPTILANNEYYAPYNEETILNVLLWKKGILQGLPYIYVNGTLDNLDLIYDKVSDDTNEQELSKWVRVPATKDNLLFIHGEKNIDIMEKMIEKLKTI
jgi:FkbM family methyltransferase